MRAMQGRVADPLPLEKACDLVTPFPSPEENADGAAGEVGDGQVEFSVAVGVAEGDGDGVCASGEGGLGLEGSVAIAEHDADVVVAAVGVEQVRLAVA